MAKTVTLRSSDGMELKADLKAMMSHSRVVRSLVEVTGSDGVIPVPNVPGTSLELLIEYCEDRNEMVDAGILDEGTHFVNIDLLMGLTSDLTPSRTTIFPFQTAGIGQETSVCESAAGTIQYTMSSQYTGPSTFNRENIVEAKRSLEEEVHDTNFVNKHCSMLNLNTISA